MSFSPRHLEGTSLPVNSARERSALVLPTPRGCASESLRTPIPAEAGLLSRHHADLPPQVALLQTRVWEHTRGTLPPRALPAPCVPRGQRSPGGAGGSGVRTGTERLGSRQCQIWEIAVFSLLTSSPEARRGGEVRRALCPSAEGPGPGGGTRPPRGSRLGQELGGPRPATAASLGPWGEPRAARVGPL